MEPFTWQTEYDEPAPSALVEVDDRLRADEALRRVRKGETLWYRGTFFNAKQLLGAMTRRLPEAKPAASALEAFRQERARRQLEHALTSKLVVGLDAQYRLLLGGAPDVRTACEAVWGGATRALTLTPLSTLLGMLGAEAWRQKGLEVPGLEGRLHPAFGVYSPTRAEYVELLTRVRDVSGTRVFDVGCGTGVLSFVLLQRGAASAVATDLEPRAVACAADNASRLQLSRRFVAEQRALFPEGRADLVVCNPPWIPEAPKSRFDAAVFDEGSAFLLAFLNGLAPHLEPGGRGLLIISDLAELLGLRPRGWLQERIAAAGLVIARRHAAKPRHGKARDRSDPLHAARSREVTTLYELTLAPGR
ncbi:MAG: class I SAM-dependent methyltransferase [Myxococcaceae bacterium]|nr:class I SAM-dependent methyltransferase [Myxococcaceae bacterium]